jgi:hypothetical protein
VFSAFTERRIGSSGKSGKVVIKDVGAVNFVKLFTLVRKIFESLIDRLGKCFEF